MFQKIGSIIVALEIVSCFPLYNLLFHNTTVVQGKKINPTILLWFIEDVNVEERAGSYPNSLCGLWDGMDKESPFWASTGQPDEEFLDERHNSVNWLDISILKMGKYIS